METDKPKPKLAIKLDNVKRISDAGLHRAYIFLGLGVNAARSNELNKYEIDESFDFIIVKQTNDEKTIKLYKKEFERWIIGNSLRELIESQEKFLHEIYNIMLSHFSVNSINC